MPITRISCDRCEKETDRFIKTCGEYLCLVCYIEEEIEDTRDKVENEKDCIEEHKKKLLGNEAALSALESRLAEAKAQLSHSHERTRS